MHELQVTQSILGTVLAAARTNGLRRVVRIHLVIGRLNDLHQEWIQHYFDYLSEGSPAQGAKILVEDIPAALECQDCGFRFEVQMHEVDTLRCSGCNGTNLSLARGRELLIRDMEGE